MVTLYILFILLNVLGMAALRWGTNSSERIGSQEWERRQQWPGFH